MARQRLAADRMRLTVESALGDYLDDRGDDYDDQCSAQLEATSRAIEHLTAAHEKSAAAARAAVTAERQEIGRTVASLGLPTEGVATELDAAILDANGLLNPKLSLLRERRDWPRWAPPEADVRAWEREFAAAVAPDFLGFRFTPGMLFGAPLQWWSSRRPRRTPHEGLDFHLFARRRAGSDEPEEEVCTIPPGTCVRSIRPGVVAAVFADFVASTVLVRHDDVVREGRVLHTVWGHVTAAVAAGDELRARQMIGAIAPSQTAAPAHLHLSAAWIPAGATADVGGWEQLLAVAKFGCPTVVDDGSVLGSKAGANGQELRAWEAARGTRVHGGFCETVVT